MSKLTPTSVISQGAIDGLPLRILLVDDHPAIRLGMIGLIRQAYQTTEVCEASNEQEALKQLESGSFDAVFLDLGLPDGQGDVPMSEVGKRLLSTIRQRDDGPPVIVMSGEPPTAELMQELMRLGAATFVPKNAIIQIQLDAIRRALAGGVWLPAELIGKGGTTPPPSESTLSGALPSPISHEDLGITPREFDVLRLALSGLSPIKIALTLGINHDNVRKRMQRLYERFGNANQASLHAYFARTGQTLGILQSLPKSPTHNRN